MGNLIENYFIIEEFFTRTYFHTIVLVLARLTRPLRAPHLKETWEYPFSELRKGFPVEEYSHFDQTASPLLYSLSFRTRVISSEYL